MSGAAKKNSVTLEMKKPKVFYSNEAWEKIQHLINKTSKEVSGFGPVRILQDGSLYVIDAIMRKQEGSGGSTDMDEESVAEIPYLFREIEHDFLLWWHSHPTFNVYMSGIDKDTIHELGQHGAPLLASCFNQKGEVFTALYMKDAVQVPWGDPQPLYWEQLETRFYLREDPRKEAWDAEFSENFKEKKYNYTSTYATHQWQAGKVWCPEKQGYVWPEQKGDTGKKTEAKEGGKAEEKEPEALIEDLRDMEDIESRLSKHFIMEHSAHFTREEIKILERDAGLTDESVNALLLSGMRPHEIVNFVQSGWTDPEELLADWIGLDAVENPPEEPTRKELQ